MSDQKHESSHLKLFFFCLSEMHDLFQSLSDISILTLKKLILPHEEEFSLKGISSSYILWNLIHK